MNRFGKFNLTRVTQKGLARDTLWMLLAQCFGLAMQMGSFVMIARSLGAKDYGAFIGITSFAAVLAPFVGLGSGDVLVQKVTRDRQSFRHYWGSTLLTVLGSGLVMIAIGLVIIHAILPEDVSLLIIGLVLLSDLVGLKLWEVATKALLAVDWVSLSARFKVLLNLNKLLAAIVLLTCFRNSSIMVWALLYLAATGITAIAGVLLVSHKIGMPRLGGFSTRSELKQGFYFSISASSDNINASIDKTMLAALGTLEATGLYAAAYRCIEAGYFGLHALSGATYAKFFQQGAEGGILGTLRFAKSLLPTVLLYGLGAAIGFNLIAPFIPTVLGAEYLGAIEAVRWLSAMPLLLSLQYLAADTLTGAGFQGARSAVQVSSALVNLSLNFLLIPLYSWRGAAWATLISEILKLLSLCIIVALYLRRQPRQAL